MWTYEKWPTIKGPCRVRWGKRDGEGFLPIYQKKKKTTTRYCPVRTIQSGLQRERQKQSLGNNNGTQLSNDTQSKGLAAWSL